MKKKLPLALLGLLSLASLASVAQAMGRSGANPASRIDARSRVVDASGNIRVPANYRATYSFLGSWAIAADHGQGSKQIHDVYASPGTVAAYHKTGRFPDGSVLVKEVYETATGAMTTGIVSHAEKLKGWFVMVRDSKDNHPGNKLWGDGWGWSWFDASDPLKTTSTDYKANCRSCHIPARGSEWVYVQGYPVLK